MIGSCAGVFYAFDKNDGTPVWIYDITADGAREFHGDPLIAGDVVYVGTDGPAGYVYAFDRATGELRWKSAADKAFDDKSGFAADILQSGGLLYTVGIGDQVVALDPRDGSKKWKFQSTAPRDRFRFSNAAAIAGDRVFFAGLDGILYALDAKTGAIVWKKDFQSPFTTAVISHHKEIMIGAMNKRLYRVRQSDGSVVATLELPHAPAYTPVIHGDKVFVVSDKELFAVDTSLSAIAWSRKAAKEWSTPRPRVWNGAILAGDGPDLYALDPKSGRELWQQRLGGVIRGIGGDGEVLYVGTYRGDIFALRPRVN